MYTEIVMPTYVCLSETIAALLFWHCGLCVSFLSISSECQKWPQTLWNLCTVLILQHIISGFCASYLQVPLTDCHRATYRLPPCTHTMGKWHYNVRSMWTRSKKKKTHTLKGMICTSVTSLCFVSVLVETKREDAFWDFNKFLNSVYAWRIWKMLAATYLQGNKLLLWSHSMITWKAGSFFFSFLWQGWVSSSYKRMRWQCAKSKSKDAFIHRSRNTGINSILLPQQTSQHKDKHSSHLKFFPIELLNWTTILS